MKSDPWQDAFELLSLACPCEALATIRDGINATSPDHVEMAMAWGKLGACVEALVEPATMH